MPENNEFKCPCCGNILNIEDGVKTLRCPACETELDVDSVRAFGEDIKTDGSDDFTWESSAGSAWTEGEKENIRVYQCKSCGAELVTDPETQINECPYCANPLVVSDTVSAAMKPDCVIPFKLNKEAARARFRKHMAGKKLLPGVFKESKHLDEIKGIYVPFWLFDTSVNAYLRFEGTQSTGWSDTSYDYKRTDYFGIYRSGRLAFDQVPIDGSSRMADELMESLEPFKMKEAVPFQVSVLNGYMADSYDVNEEKSVERVNERVKRATEAAFKATISGYENVNISKSTVSFSNGKAVYALLPVWILNTTWKGKKYVFAVNGQTGKFVGDMPMSKSLYFKHFFAAAGIMALVTFIAQIILYCVH